LGSINGKQRCFLTGENSYTKVAKFFPIGNGFVASAPQLSNVELAVAA